MRNFVFQNPTKIIFGKGRVEEVGKEIISFGSKKILFLYGQKSIFKTGLYERVVKSLSEAGVEFVELGGVKPNPVLTKVNEGIAICKKEQVDGILAVGGGSVIDSAKAIGRGFHYDGNVWDLFEGAAQSFDSLPVYSILTISATASEMNANSVVTNEAENKKWPIPTHQSGYPKFSIIDPELQKTLPASQTANGAADTLSHVFEWYFDGTDNNDLNDEFAEGIMRTTMKHARVLIDDPENYESRAQLAWCSTNALNMLLQTGRGGGDWATHQIEHSVSAFYDIAHGAGLAILFPAWMKYVYKNDLKKFERFAEKVFGITDGTPEEKSLEAINRLKKYLKEIGAPVSLKDVNVKEEDLEAMAANATMRGAAGKLKKLEQQDVLEIYKIAFNEN